MSRLPDDADDPRTVVQCARCGVTATEVPLTWSTAREKRRGESGADRLVHYCDRCSRDNVRAIEGRLDEDWW